MSQDEKQAWVHYQVERMKRWQRDPPMWGVPLLSDAIWYSWIFLVMFVVAYDKPIWLGEIMLGLLWLASFGLVFGLIMVLVLHLAGVI